MKPFKNTYLPVLTLAVLIITSCNGAAQETGDLIIKGGNIYTVNDSLPIVESVVIKGNKIIFTGDEEDAVKLRGKKTKIIDLEGKIMIPGFIDSHGHFLGMGNSKLILDLRGLKSYDELIDLISESVKNAEPGDWIIGRGWHQDKWTGNKEKFINGFPTHHKLSEVSPNNPVILTHASGHSVFVNKHALDLAGISKRTFKTLKRSIEGGEIVLDKKGNPTGILNENAEFLILKIMPDENNETVLINKIDAAIEECLKNGITGFHDAGISKETVDLYMNYKKAGKLEVRIHAMLNNDINLLNDWFAKGPLIDSADHILTIRSVKVLADGALGNRGAWLLQEYSDQEGWYGLETTSMDYVYETAIKCLQNGFQLCIHAIGDRANREVLDNYEKAFKSYPDLAFDHRFRIEHAQHLTKEDIPRFANLNVIAAMQGIHMSSDRPWAIDRLGIERIEEGAYVWQKLIQSGTVVMNGTDVPVEPVNPIACFYASVSRKTLQGTPDEGCEQDQKMTRQQALRSYTLNGAYGSFEEHIKGSIEVGKLADFAIIDKDIMTIQENDILKAKVVMTIFNGKIVYSDD